MEIRGKGEGGQGRLSSCRPARTERGERQCTRGFQRCVGVRPGCAWGQTGRVSRQGTLGVVRFGRHEQCTRAGARMGRYRGGHWVLAAFGGWRRGWDAYWGRSNEAWKKAHSDISQAGKCNWRMSSMQAADMGPNCPMARVYSEEGATCTLALDRSCSAAQ